MILDVAAWRARETPDRAAVLWRNQWYSCRQLDERAQCVAGRLAAEGVHAGDRVAILSPNHLAHLDLMLAAPKLGFVHVPFNYRLSAAEQKEIAAVIQPKFVLHDRAHADQADGLGARLLTLERYADWLAGPVAAFDAPALTADDIHMILFTGGSTGVPKGAQIPYRQTSTNAANTIRGWALSGDDCAIQATPAFHAAVNVLATPLLHAGGRVIWAESFEAGEYLQCASEHGATVLFMVPAMFQMLAEHADFAAADLGKVRFAIAGGAPCPPAVRESFAKRGVHFRLGYGMTECGVNCFALDNVEALQHPDSVGRPMAGLEAVIRAPGGAPVTRGNIGELTFRGDVVCAGYFRKPAETAATIRDGWLWTGDLAREDDAGRFYICGRRKEMYISGGENVYPAEVESALSECPGVSECAVIGVPHARWGETGMAAVAASPGAKLSMDQLRAHLKARLAGYKVPTEFMFLDTLPKTGAGKIDKPAIRAMCEAAPARAAGDAR